MPDREPTERPPRPAPGSLLTPQTAGAGGMLIAGAVLAALVTQCQASQQPPTDLRPTVGVTTSTGTGVTAGATTGAGVTAKAAPTTR